MLEVLMWVIEWVLLLFAGLIVLSLTIKVVVYSYYQAMKDIKRRDRKDG